RADQAAAGRARHDGRGGCRQARGDRRLGNAATIDATHARPVRTGGNRHHRLQLGDSRRSRGALMRIPTGIAGIRGVRAAVIALGLLAIVHDATAQPVQVPDTWGGDLWSRPRLTGSWGGFRDELGKKGVVFDVDALLTPQGVASGGRDTRAEFWGNTEYTLNLDTGKLGLWPGGFLKAYAMSSFGNSVNQASGAIIPVNTAALVPTLDEPTTALMHLTFMQFLSPKFGMFAGKVYTLDADANEFADDYHGKFLNMGLDINTVGALFPISAFGGGLVALPWDGAMFTVSVLDPDGTPTNNDLS